MKMIDVGNKAKTERIAVASGRVHAAAATLRAISAGRIEKGDVLATARLAGIIAAKKTPDLVPLCHPISLAAVEVTVGVNARWVNIQARVKTVDRTGVEMEALTAVSAAALTVYDMCKSIDPAMRIEAVQLDSKSGGKSGPWHRAARRSES